MIGFESKVSKSRIKSYFILFYHFCLGENRNCEYQKVGKMQGDAMVRYRDRDTGDHGQREKDVHVQWVLRSKRSIRES